MISDVSLFVVAFLGLLTGLILGLLHFATLRFVANLFLHGRHRLLAIALQLLRFALVVAVFIGLARAGVLALLFGALGFVIGRAIVFRQFREKP